MRNPPTTFHADEEGLHIYVGGVKVTTIPMYQFIPLFYQCIDALFRKQSREKLDGLFLLRDEDGETVAADRLDPPEGSDKS